MAKEIVIEIDLDTAEMTLETLGFQGKGCAQVHEGFARANGKATSVVRKPEFNAPAIAQNRLKQRG